MVNRTKASTSPLISFMYCQVGNSALRHRRLISRFLGAEIRGIDYETSFSYTTQFSHEKYFCEFRWVLNQENLHANILYNYMSHPHPFARTQLSEPIPEYRAFPGVYEYQLSMVQYRQKTRTSNIALRNNVPLPVHRKLFLNRLKYLCCLDR